MTEDLGLHLERTWTALAELPAGPREWRAMRVECAHPLSILAGLRESDAAKSLLLECPIDCAPASRIRFETGGLALVDERSREESLLRIAIVLERPDLSEVFRALATDLIQATVADDAKAALALLVSRLGAWQRCLRARASSLDREAIIGLWGELAILYRMIESSDPAQSIGAWKGPEDGLHDFVQGGEALEVKCAEGTGSRIWISSLDQLDDEGLSSLLLLQVTVSASDHGLSLPDMARRISELIKSRGGTIQEFERKMIMSGYLPSDIRLLESLRFEERGLCAFKVNSGFPRLLRSGVPAGVSDAKYLLDRAHLEPHRLSNDDLMRAIRNVGGDA